MKDLKPKVELSGRLVHARLGRWRVPAVRRKNNLLVSEGHNWRPVIPDECTPVRCLYARPARSKLILA